MPNETVTSTTSTTNTASIPANMLEQIEALRAAGATIGIPLVISLDDKTQKALAAQHMTFGEDLARFSAKAAVATVLAAGGALAVWVITKPAEPGM